MYYIMPQRIVMRLITNQSAIKKSRTNNAPVNNAPVNTMLPQPRQRMVPFGGNVFRGNMNNIFDARGRPCG